MNRDEAYYIVFKDLTKHEGMFTGRYDATNGSEQYMYGIGAVMGYIAYQVGYGCYEGFVNKFSDNMFESKKKAKPNDSEREDER